MFVILWEFKIVPDKLPEFLAAYQLDGEWAQLFRLGIGYLGTELLCSTADPYTFVTIDRWNTQDDFEHFQECFGEQYRSLDERLQAYTLSERLIGNLDTHLESRSVS